MALLDGRVAIVTGSGLADGTAALCGIRPAGLNTLNG
jgi:hypothetical protein